MPSTSGGRKTCSMCLISLLWLALLLPRSRRQFAWTRNGPRRPNASLTPLFARSPIVCRFRPMQRASSLASGFTSPHPFDPPRSGEPQRNSRCPAPQSHAPRPPRPAVRAADRTEGRRPSGGGADRQGGRRRAGDRPAVPPAGILRGPPPPPDRSRRPSPARWRRWRSRWCGTSRPPRPASPGASW